VKAIDKVLETATYSDSTVGNFADFIKYIVDQWQVLLQAPWIFAGGLVFVTCCIWKALSWRYGGVIAQKDTEIATTRSARDDYKARLDEADRKIKEMAPKGEMATKEPAEFLTEKDAHIVPISDLRFSVMFNRPMRVTPSLIFKDPDPKTFNMSHFKLLYWSPLGFTVEFPSAAKVGKLRFEANARK
jgi:hypothetical protein